MTDPWLSALRTQLQEITGRVDAPDPDRDGVKRDIESRSQQPAGMRAGMKQQHNAGKRAKVQVKQQPIAKRAGATPVHLFAQRISHHRRHAKQSRQARGPAHRSRVGNS